MSIDTDAFTVIKNGTDEYEMNTIRVLPGKVFINISTVFLMLKYYNFVFDTNILIDGEFISN